MGEVMVLHAALTDRRDPAGDDALLRQLPYARRLELERRGAAARAASLHGVRLLAGGVARLRRTALDLAQLRYPGGGKPFLDGGPWFSVSHSGGRVAVAVSDHCELGLDLEDLDRPGLDRDALERWVAVEAALKAVGAGLVRAGDVRLSSDLGTAEIAGVTLRTQALALAPGCVARLATRRPVQRVVVVDAGPGQGAA